MASRSGFLVVVAIFITACSLGAVASAQAPPPLAVWGSYGSAVAQLSSPRGIAVGPDGLVHVADTGNDRIQVFGSEGQPIRQFGTSGSGPGQLLRPSSVAVAPDGEVYVVDTGNVRVQVFAADGLLLREWGHSGNEAEPGAFGEPQAIAVSPLGDVFIVDAANGTLQRFTESESFGVLWGGWAGFRGSAGVATTPDGDVVVTLVNARDYSYSPVMRFRPNSEWVGSFGTFFGPGPLLLTATGVCVDAAGTAYVLDASTGQAFVFSPDGMLRELWWGTGTGFGQLLRPNAIAQDGTGNFYVADTGNNRIQKFGYGPTRISQHTWGEVKTRSR